jgi:PadR family transcriptional regulator PadR
LILSPASDILNKVRYMPNHDILGDLELAVMAAIIRLRSDAYGMRIRAFIGELTGRKPPVGSIYVALDRLKEKGYISSVLADPTAERGGRAKQFYSIEAPGEAAFARSRDHMLALLGAVGPCIGGARA